MIQDLVNQGANLLPALRAWYVLPFSSSKALIVEVNEAVEKASSS